MNTRAITAHIPNELAEQLDKISARIDRPKGWVVKQALTTWVELEEKRHQLRHKPGRVCRHCRFLRFRQIAAP